MDAADFQEWLGGTAKLTPSQRREAFRSLALVEAMVTVKEKDGGCCDCPVEAAVVTAVGSTIAPVLTVPSASPALTRPSRTGVDVVAEIGRRRVSGMGCPHCANRDVISWGKASLLQN